MVDRSISSAPQQQNSSNAVAQHQELKDDVVAMLSNENMDWEGDGTPLPQSPQTSVAEIVAAAVADAVHSENLTVDPELVAVAVVAALTVSTTPRTLSSVFLWADSFSLCRLCFCLCSSFTSA